MKLKVKSGKLPEVLKKIAADQAVICLKLIGQEVGTSFPDQLKSTVKLKEMQSWIKLRFSQIAQLLAVTCLPLISTSQNHARGCKISLLPVYLHAALDKGKPMITQNIR